MLLFLILIFKSSLLDIECPKVIGKFVSIREKDVSAQDDQFNLIFSSNTLSKNKCLKTCNLMFACSIVKTTSSACKLYNQSTVKNLVVSTNSAFIYVKYKDIIYDGLTHYWPFDGDYKDKVGNNHLTPSTDVSFDQNRFSFSNKSVNLLNSYLTLPPDVYFKGDFSIIGWIKVNQIKAWSRWFDCGINSFNNELYVVLSYTNDLTGKLEIGCYKTQYAYSVFSPTQLSLRLGQWDHVALTLKNSNALFYLNGKLIGSYPTFLAPDNVVRSTCYFGKSLGLADPTANANFDEIKIYNRSLSVDEIQYDISLFN